MGEFDNCPGQPCDTALIGYLGPHYWLGTNCPSCVYAVYAYAYCTCEFIPATPTAYTRYLYFYNFIGCVDYYGDMPADGPCVETAQEAFTLAMTYGLNPTRLARGGRMRTQDSGKFEPDRKFGEETRTITLASYIDKTNVLIKYRPADLES